MLSVVDRYTPSQPRTAVVATCISTSSAKPRPNSVSRSSSRPTTTRSTTICTKKGEAIANTSSTSDSRITCAMVPCSPPRLPISCQAVILSRSSRGAKPTLGSSSAATPV